MAKIRKAKRGDPPFTTYSCDVCSELDTVEMVQCDTCNQFTHFSCAGVDASIATKPWCCRACEAKKKPKASSTVTSESPPPATPPALTTTGSSTAKAPLTEEQKKYHEKLLTLHQREITRLKREHALDLERERSSTNREHETAREAMSTAEALRTELSALKESTEQHHQVVQQHKLRADQAAKEAERSRSLLVEANAELETLRAAANVKIAQTVETQTTGNSSVVQPEKSFEERLADLRSSLSSNVNTARQIEKVVTESAPRGNVQFSSDAVAATIINKLATMVPQLLRELAPGLTTKPGPLQDSIPHFAFSQEVERSEEIVEVPLQPAQQTPVDRLAVTMNRSLLAKLPEFDGCNIKKWPYFESVYDSTTARGQYTDAENIDRLRLCLKGNAEQTVRSHLLYPISAAEIMSELREAYGKPDQIVKELTTELLEIAHIKSPVDPMLRNFSTGLRNYVASLITIGKEDALKNTFIRVQLEEKLHHTHRREWIAQRNQDEACNREVSIRSFSEFVKARVRELPPSSSSRPEPSSRSEPERKVRRLNAHVQAAGDTGTTTSPKGCFKCKGFHVLVNCSEFKLLNPKQRSKFAYDNRICSSCLKSDKHSNKDCRGKRSCNEDGCQLFHHPLLHYPRNTNARSNSQQTFRASSNVAQNQPLAVPERTSTGNLQMSANAQSFASAGPSNVIMQHKDHLSHESEGSVLFKILPVRLYGEKTFIDTFAFLDDGSSLTLIERNIYDRLELQGEQEELHLQWTKGITRTEEAFRTTVTISGPKGKGQHVLTNVYAVEHLDLPTQTVDAKALKARYSHLRGISIPDFVNGKPSILIGLQHSTFLLGTNNHSAGKDDPIASKTQLGWTVFGTTAHSLGVFSLTDHKRSGIQLSISEASKGDEDLHKLVKGYFSTENFGVMPPTKDLISAENERSNSIMNKTLKMIDGRYEIGLLWKSDNVRLPDSYPMAMKRLVSLERSLKKNPDLLKWKNDHVKELIAKGYARKATEDELKKDWPRIWYCPTFVVINPNKLPPKPRDVADVAASVQGQSLNSNLLKGPDNLVPLLQGLFKFRENAIAVNADVKEMFHQIRVTEEDQQCQRFLYRDCDDTQPPTVYIMQRMMFGPTCSPSCAQFVKNQHAALYEKDKPEASNALIKYTYVDDYFNSHATVEEALRVTKDAFMICDTMGFDLLGVQSNKLEVLNELPANKVKSSLVSIEPQESESYVTKVLGMYWQSFPDFFTYKLCRDELVEKMLSSNFAPSKREILRTLMRTFDPLGLIAHYLIRGKIVLQEIWREGTEWDEPIPINLVKQWQEFIRQLPNIDKLKIPRRYATIAPTDSKATLIVFVDASEQAFAATAYIRFENGSQVDVAHVMAKAKVAPIKRLTIPQLELQAAVLGVRLAKTIKDLHSFPLENVKYLSDSKVVLSWICSRKYNFKTFVAARIGEILESSNRREWYHVGSKDNVADDATKWNDPTMGNYSTRWFKGPQFLTEEVSVWPIKPAVDCDEDEESIKHSQLFVHKFQRNVSIKLSTIDNISARFKARWTSLVRVIAFMLRFAKKNLKRVYTAHKFISPDEFQEAEMFIIRKIQHDAFSDEIKAFEAGEVSVSQSSQLLSLCPFFEDGIIRMSSRSQKAQISYAARCPPILPNKHELVDLFIQYHHEKNFHMGEEMTIADIRERAWIINARKAVQRVKRQCQMCKILRAKPIMPLMGELPKARVDFGVKPFTHTGLDAFGPYNVKFGRGSVKRYGLIFTCLTYRAVHLEILNDMSTDACIMAIRRFLVRRGWSVHFYSDNGKNFVGAKNVLHEELKQLKDLLGSALSNQLGIQWHFQPAYSPWWGGAWERLIKSIKLCINFLMTEEYPREDVFQNAMIEAEFWMNRRPLTHTPISQEDAKPLTPNSVLFGDEQNELAVTIGMFSINDACSRKTYRRAQHLVNKFMSRWTREYLPSINRRSKWYEKTHPVKIDDIVILTDPTEPKNAWKKGRIINLYPGADGVTRAVDVQLADHSVKKNRAVGRIAVLDVDVFNPSAGVQTAPGMSSSD